MSTTELDIQSVEQSVEQFTPHSLSIADISPISHADWPGRSAITVLMQGCPWRCTHCCQPDMQDPMARTRVEWEDVSEHLEVRRGMVDAVVFSGGEPARQPGLIAAIREVKAMGYQVGLHTAGARPSRLAAVLPEVDWVAIDIKAAPARHGAITGSETSGVKAWRSLDLIKESGVDYEVRLTIDPTVHTRQDIVDTVREVIRRGAKAPVLQQARPAESAAVYRRALRGRGMYDVIRHDDFPDLARR